MARPTPPNRPRALGERFKTERPPSPPARTVEATIERIVPGGVGLAHADGLTLFVSEAAPGDRALVRIDRIQGRSGFGTIEELLEPSPLRVVDPHQGPCGGCDFQHLTYETQLAAKVDIVRDCLRRIAGIEPPDELPIVPSPRQWGYRARAEWQYDGAVRLIGSYERGTHRICEGKECEVLRPELQAVLDDIRTRLQAGALPPGRTEIRAAVGDEGTTLFPPLTGEPERELSVAVGDERYRFDASCFFQANLDVLPALVDETLRYAEEAAAETLAASDTGADDPPVRLVAVDLYCGVGLFSLPLARRFDRVYGVDAYSRAIQYARQNAEDAGLTNTKFANLPVEQWLAERARGIGQVALAVIDPPRTGLDPASLQGLIRLEPMRIAYVSCDPATLARDLKQLGGHGYELQAITAIDMFPQTHHVEVVAHLRGREED
jgi:tRNA/tmRNA/rRNA uracil-C5-methylase (TrmA/RlmC/RlmD family)